MEISMESVSRRHLVFPRLDKLQIVIVDDHRQVRSAVGNFLSDLGAIVHEVFQCGRCLEVSCSHSTSPRYF
jgi:PleD family two-component response regulator